ncbi:hypothetical protein MY1884_009757 [Beauveria asiatica]
MPRRRPASEMSGGEETPPRDNPEPERGDPRATPCGRCLGRMKTSGELTCFWPSSGSGSCTKCAQMKQRCPRVSSPRPLI